MVTDERPSPDTFPSLRALSNIDRSRRHPGMPVRRSEPSRAPSALRDSLRPVSSLRTSPPAAARPAGRTSRKGADRSHNAHRVSGTDAAESSQDDSLAVAGLFAGVGGIERGLASAGHRSELLCELDESAATVLRYRFPDTPIVSDVRELDQLPRVDLVAAGFPCQDLSQAGRTAGITGDRSGLVGQVFRLMEGATSARWLLLENVPFMLQLERGEAMRFLTKSLDGLGFRWAYRVVDARAFGLPQRRKRVLLLASRDADPREILFSEDAGPPPPEDPQGVACGFYWTEGVRGLGWAIDSVPTLKGGSTIGIPSPPAIWLPEGGFVLPEIRDGERLQGFPADWTAPADAGRPRRSNGPRWKLVGNAVNVPVAEWLGGRLRDPRPYDPSADTPLKPEDRWPIAGWGQNGTAWKADISSWPRHETRQPLASFLKYPTSPLSARATAGFLNRTRRSRLRFPEGFIADLERHLERMTQIASAA